MDLSNYTQTELLKFKNDLNDVHEKIKNDIIIKVDKIDELKNEINNLISELNDIESLYKKIIEEMQSKK